MGLCLVGGLRTGCRIRVRSRIRDKSISIRPQRPLLRIELDEMISVQGNRLEIR